MAAVRIAEVSRFYPGSAGPAVDRLTLDVADGEFMVLVGPSGCGKSTVLKMLAGLEDVDEGSIFVDGRDVTDLPPRERDVAMVFQNYSLYPHMTVADNIGFALKLAGVGREERDRRVRAAAVQLELEPYLDQPPKALSGGQRQRVAMARAIVRDPAVFLMDEPLSNLDVKLRLSTRAGIAALQARLGVTTVYVTHDQVEAMAMGTRIAVLGPGGRLQQVATPRELYVRPETVVVAGYIGTPPMNLLRAPLVERSVRLGAGVLALPADVLADPQTAGLREVTVGIRPESFQPVGAGEPGLRLRASAVARLGAESLVTADLLDSGSSAEDPGSGRSSGYPPVVVTYGRWDAPRPDDILDLTVPPAQLHVFHPGTGRRLGL